MEYTYCSHCKKNIHTGTLWIQEVDEATVILCPSCGQVLSVKTETPAPLDYSSYFPTVDQLTYTIHCLQKQVAKVDNAKDQLYKTITKLEVLRELAQEKELN